MRSLSVGACGIVLSLSIYVWITTDGHWGVIVFWAFLVWTILLAIAWFGGPLLDGVDTEPEATE